MASGYSAKRFEENRGKRKLCHLNPFEFFDHTASEREKGQFDEECCPPFDRTVDGPDSPRHLRSDRSPSSDSHLPCARLNARFPQQSLVGPLACEISIHQICLR